MAMKFFTFHNKLVADLATDHKQDNFFAFYIIQRAKVSGAQFKLGQRIGPQLLDCTSWSRRLIRKACQNRCLKYPLITCGKRLQVRLRFFSDFDSICHFPFRY